LGHGQGPINAAIECWAQPVQVVQAVQNVQAVRAVGVALNNLNDLNVWNMREQERCLRGEKLIPRRI